MAVFVEGGCLLGVFVGRIHYGDMKLAAGCFDTLAEYLDMYYWSAVRGRGACLKFGISSWLATSFLRLATMLNGRGVDELPGERMADSKAVRTGIDLVSWVAMVAGKEINCDSTSTMIRSSATIPP